VRRLRVPADFAALNGSLGAARSLHYASLHSAARAEDWVVHLAAGTVLRERSVDAVLAHCVDEAYRLEAMRRRNDSHLALRVRLAQGGVCIGRTAGSWLAFLGETRRAGESLGLHRCQACGWQSAHCSAAAAAHAPPPRSWSSRRRGREWTRPFCWCPTRRVTGAGRLTRT